MELKTNDRQKTNKTQKDENLVFRNKREMQT